MSWKDQIVNFLINYKTKYYDTYNNVLTEAAIVGLDGCVWATTRGLEITKNDIDKLNEFFEGTFSPFILLGGKKYLIIHYERSGIIYLKRLGYGLERVGIGATVAKTQKAYIIGIYDYNKKYSYNGRPLPQCVGMCNTVVEEYANLLKTFGY